MTELFIASRENVADFYKNLEWMRLLYGHPRTTTLAFFFLWTGWMTPLEMQSSANRSRWLLQAELLSVCCSFSALPQFQSPESTYRTYCHVGGRQSDYNENNIPRLTRSSDVFPERLHCGWCATNVPAVSCHWLVPIRDRPGAQPSSLAFWNSENNVVRHHLPPSATKTRAHAVQASCWICMCDPLWRIIPSFSVGRTSPHTSLQWLTSSCPCALKWALPSCCHGKIGSNVKKK